MGTCRPGQALMRLLKSSPLSSSALQLQVPLENVGMKTVDAILRLVDRS